MPLIPVGPSSETKRPTSSGVGVGGHSADRVLPTTSIRYDVGDHEDDYVDALAIPAFDEDPTVLAPEQDEYRITVFELRAGRS